MSECAILFARYPEPGQVKTRLTPWLTPEAAATLYAGFLRDALDLLVRCGAARKRVAFTPVSREREMARLLPDPTLELTPQAEGDLGARMGAAMASARAAGAARCVIFGSDCPTLAPDTLDRALAALGSRDVVLGPATDGGYYLVGCAGPPPERLFSDISWGTSSVLSATLERLDGAALALLEPWRDVDVPADVDWLATHIEALVRAGDGRAPHTREALGALHASRVSAGD